MVLKTLTIAALLLCAGSFWKEVRAQEKNTDYIPTRNTVPDARPDPRKQGPKEEKIRYIITKDTKNTLAGNKCFEDATRAMGFLYLAVPPGQAENYDGVTRWFHNFGVKFMIMLRYGIFWKTKVNKKFKECKYSSGDFVG